MATQHSFFYPVTSRTIQGLGAVHCRDGTCLVCHRWRLACGPGTSKSHGTQVSDPSSPRHIVPAPFVPGSSRCSSRRSTTPSSGWPGRRRWVPRRRSPCPRPSTAPRSRPATRTPRAPPPRPTTTSWARFPVPPWLAGPPAPASRWPRVSAMATQRRRADHPRAAGVSSASVISTSKVSVACTGAGVVPPAERFRTLAMGTVARLPYPW